MEEEKNGQDLELTVEQIRLLEKANPCFRERHIESPYRGYLLCQDTFQVGTLKGIGRVYLQAVVDTYGSYAFGFLHPGKLPECAVAVIHNDALPFCRERGIPVAAMITEDGREFCGTEAHPYELYLSLKDIEHHKTRVRRPQTTGFVERFDRTVLDEFFRKAFREKLYEPVEALQEDLNARLHHYNHERPPRGYRNMGRRPIETIEVGKAIKEQVMKEAA